MKKNWIKILSNSSKEESPIEAAAASIANEFDLREIKEIFANQVFLDYFQLFLLRKKDAIIDEIPPIFSKIIEYKFNKQEKKEIIFFDILKEIIKLSPCEFVELAPELILEPMSQEILTQIFEMDFQFHGKFNLSQFVNAVRNVEDPTDEFLAASKKFVQNFEEDFDEKSFETPLQRYKKENEMFRGLIKKMQHETGINQNDLKELGEIIKAEKITQKERCEEIIRELSESITSEQENMKAVEMESETERLRMIIKDMEKAVCKENNEEEDEFSLKLENDSLRNTISTLNAKMQAITDDKHEDINEVRVLLYEKAENLNETEENEETTEQIKQKNEELTSFINIIKEKLDAIYTKRSNEEEEEEEEKIIDIEEAAANRFHFDEIIKEMREQLKEKEKDEEEGNALAENQKLKETISKLREEIKKADEIVPIEAKKRDAESEKKLKEEIQRLMKENKEKEQEIKAMRAEKKKQEIKSSLSNAGKGLSNIKNMLAKGRKSDPVKEKEFLEEELVEKESENLELKEQIAKLQDSILSKNKELASLNAKIKENAARTAKEIDELNEHESKLKSEIVSLKEKCTSANTKLEKIKAETNAVINRFKEEIERARNEKDQEDNEKDEIIKKLEEGIQEQAKINEEKSKEYIQLINQKDANMKQVESKYETLKESTANEIKKYKEENARIKAQINIDNMINESEKRRAGDYVKLEMKMQKDEKKYKKQIEELESQIEELMNKETPELESSGIKEVFDLEPITKEIYEEEQPAIEEPLILPPSFPRGVQEAAETDNKRKPRKKKSDTLFSKLFYHIF